MAADFSDLARIFEQWGVMDFILPFILVFTIVFAVMQKTKILGDRKNFNVIIALVLALTFVVPHVTGSYPLGYDPVDVMNEALPSISLVSIAAIMLLLLMGVLGSGFAAAAAPIIALVSIGFVVYIFGAALGLFTDPTLTFNWWDTQTTELVIILLVFGLIVWFITREPDKGTGLGALKDFGRAFGSLFEKNNK